MKKLRDIVLEEVDAFLDQHKNISPTALGKKSVNDGHFVHDLRRGYNVTFEKCERARSWMRDYPNGVEKKQREAPQVAA